jgi:hypothetical protein
MFNKNITMASPFLNNSHHTCHNIVNLEKMFACLLFLRFSRLVKIGKIKGREKEHIFQNAKINGGQSCDFWKSLNKMAANISGFTVRSSAGIIKKMAPTMSGDIPKCHPSERLLTSA